MNSFEKIDLEIRATALAKAMWLYLLFWLFSTIIPIMSVAADLIWSNSFTLFINISVLSIWALETVVIGVLLVSSYLAFKKCISQLKKMESDCVD
ncbi:hypothetical protein RKK46_002214 [Listeria innocua]|nr:hypothetical protein [Listeria innocua]EIX7081056.1 hypothetical protein [Listeria innocua]EIX7081915.1 hypothetical protein [Listeria innocua]EIX7084973.1 hypothetical protein [Listeria innocua]EIX7088618.1 hypothetical protein [Listeria innocua]